MVCKSFLFFPFSFWGKFGQRENQKQSKIVSDAAEFFRMLSSTDKEILDWHILSDDLVQIDWKYLEEFLGANDMTNVFLAAFTTAHARLRLYGVLESLEEKVLYFDTDSVIYVIGDGEEEPATGDFLGELTDELDGHHIVEFVSAGPKNYGYRTDENKTSCKVKGFNLNHETAKIINFNSMCSEVFLWHFFGSSHRCSMDIPRQICRDPKRQILFNRSMKKCYSVVYDKRRVLDSLDTLPYGYK